MKVVVLHSGGLDSTVLLYEAINAGHEVHTLSVNYGQRHEKELEAAAAIRDHAHILDEQHTTIWLSDADGLNECIRGSSQTDDIEVPEGHYTDESMRVTVVPNRNMLMLSLAVAYAVSHDCTEVMYAAHAGDHAIYPDCRLEFIDALSVAIDLATEGKVHLHAPFVLKTKADIVKLGDELNVPFELTWSCYKGNKLHCGKCGTCVERREAFKLAGVEDPTQYE